jgi:hypothetical protein
MTTRFQTLLFQIQLAPLHLGDPYGAAAAATAWGALYGTPTGAAAAAAAAASCTTADGDASALAALKSAMVQALAVGPAR